ncbi:MAG: hypothetical protein AAGO57_09325 [Pseudomonadota bacterium]
MRRLFAITLALFGLAGSANAEPDIKILVDREPSGISVYFATEAGALPAIFGAGADELLTPEGVVDIDGLYRGTFDTADDIFRAMDTEIDGSVADFEALSMMVHDPSILPPFATPYDAAMAVAVCNSPETVRDMHLEDLKAFLGFYAWKADPWADVSLTFPATGRESLEVEVIDYAVDGRMTRYEATLGDGTALSLSAPAPARFTTLVPLIFVAASLLSIGGLGVVARRLWATRQS